MNGRGITIGRPDLERWAGRPLSDLEVTIMERSLFATGVPAEIRAVAESFADDEDDTREARQQVASRITPEATR